jgi:hypothetical protein
MQEQRWLRRYAREFCLLPSFSIAELTKHVVVHRRILIHGQLIQDLARSALRYRVRKTAGRVEDALIQARVAVTIIKICGSRYFYCSRRLWFRRLNHTVFSSAPTQTRLARRKHHTRTPTLCSWVQAEHLLDVHGSGPRIHNTLVSAEDGEWGIWYARACDML